MAGYNIIVKAEKVENVNEYIDDWLSIPATDITNVGSLGYNEVMVSINTERVLEGALHEWHGETRPYDGGPFEIGSLIWWKSDSAEST